MHRRGRAISGHPAPIGASNLTFPPTNRHDLSSLAPLSLPRARLRARCWHRVCTCDPAAPASHPRARHAQGPKIEIIEDNWDDYDDYIDGDPNILGMPQRKRRPAAPSARRHAPGALSTPPAAAVTPTPPPPLPLPPSASPQQPTPLPPPAADAEGDSHMADEETPPSATAGSPPVDARGVLAVLPPPKPVAPATAVPAPETRGVLKFSFARKTVRHALRPPLPLCSDGLKGRGGGAS